MSTHHQQEEPKQRPLQNEGNEMNSEKSDHAGAAIVDALPNGDGDGDQVSFRSQQRQFPPRRPKALTKRQKSETNRREALREAEEVLKRVPHHELDGFNLLGVVANPRNTILSPAATAASARSYSARQSNISSQNGPSSLSSTGETGNTLVDSIQALETTLSHVTEQIDALNVVFDQWSRQYLGTLYYEDDTAALLEYLPPTDVHGQLTELPRELAELSLQSVQGYLEQSGVLSHQFWRRSRDGETWQWHESVSPDSDLSEIVEANEDEFMAQLQGSIPSLFFHTHLDLTDSNTFEQLLVVTDDNGEENEGEQTQQQNQEQQSPLAPQAPNNSEAAEKAEREMDDNADILQNLPEELIVPTENLLRLPPPESFTGLLDRVELALLQQVRSKSIAFFHETNRFGQLKGWIAGLVQEVQRVRQLLDSFTHKSVVAWELIPLLDKQRQDLAVLSAALENAGEVVRCKASISGLLSANDDLSAAEQIQYGRRLLLEENDGELHKLHALRTVQDQFNQYESLVVANLGEELVETLLEWKSLYVGNKQDPSRVRDMVRGLQMCSSLPKVGRLYGNRLLDVIRMTVRTTVGEFSDEADSSVKVCATSMTLDRFVDCLHMLFEQLLDILKSSVGVQKFFREEKEEHPQMDDFSANDVVVEAAELSSKSISELLRLRKEAHSLVTLEEMKKLWNANIGFTLEVEKLSNNFKAAGLRSTLLAQAKAFVERQHESNMSSLVAALDSERWTQCDVSADRQASLTRLCSGRAVTSKMYTSGTSSATNDDQKADRDKKKPLPDAEVEGIRYKVVWSSLLLVEMVMTNIYCAAHFQSLATNVVGKVAELLRLFNSRSTQLVLGAGAIHSAARLKSINAKHLSLVTQCLGMIISILPHVRAALMAQLPPRQHNLLNDLDKIKKEYAEHNEKVLKKFVNIIGGIVEHGLGPRIANTDFDARSRKNPRNPANPTIPACCVFLEGVFSNTRKMHQVLNGLLPPDHLQDVFSRIFAHIDQLVPKLFLVAADGNSHGNNKSSNNNNNNNSGRATFFFPTTDEGKERMLVEVEIMINNLNSLDRVRPWEFTAVRVLERQLDFELLPPPDATLDVDEDKQGVPLMNGSSSHQGSETAENGEQLRANNDATSTQQNTDDGDDDL